MTSTLPGRERADSSAALGETPDWYKDAVIYELHVRAFADSDGDGADHHCGCRTIKDGAASFLLFQVWACNIHHADKYAMGVLKVPSNS